MEECGKQGPAEQATSLRPSAAQATIPPQTLAHVYEPAGALPPEIAIMGRMATQLLSSDKEERWGSTTIVVDALWRCGIVLTIPTFAGQKK